MSRGSVVTPAIGGRIAVDAIKTADEMVRTQSAKPLKWVRKKYEFY